MQERIDLKAKVLDAFASLLRERVASAERELDGLDDAASGETKSSAGDKYETSREMFAQARDLQRSLLSEAQAHLDWISRQDPSLVRESAGPGSLLETSVGWFLLGPVPLEARVLDIVVQGLSSQGPLGKELRGTKPGDAKSFRGKDYAILAVL